MQENHRTQQPSGAQRDHLANERTLLAWARTSVAMMGLGFVVAKFGLLLRELGSGVAHRTPTGLSAGIGVALVLLGALMLAGAFLRHLRIASDIEHNRVRYDPILTGALVAALLIAGIILAVYLIITP